MADGRLLFRISTGTKSLNVEATFDFAEGVVRFVAFDNVASTLLLVWTGIYFTTN